MNKFRCEICGYIYNSIGEIDRCLLCDGNKKNILPWNEKDGFIKEEREKKRVWVSELNPSIARIEELCIDCGMCQRVCTEQINISYDKQKADNPICINCGQCIINCPTKALVPKYDYKKVLDYLNDTDYIVTISVAPSVRVAIGDLFCFEEGTFLEGKLVSALKKLKFDYVFDLTFGADMTIMEEASELIERIKNNKDLPQFTSCCPAWVKYCEIFHDELIPNLSTTKSPISIQGSLINSYFVEYNNIDRNKIINVMVAPCVAKKYEIKRKELLGMNYVITTQELVMMLKECEVDFNSLNDDPFDSLMERGSSSGLIFGTSGGVMEASLRTMYYLLTKRKAPEDFYRLEELRGIEGIKEKEISIHNLHFKVAVVNGMKNLEEILKRKEEYAYIEVMNCPGGCIGGGGQPLLPINKNKDYIKARMNSLYQNDKESKIKDCYENKDVIDGYNSYLGYPLSKKALELLHTSYKSKKNMFLISTEKK